MGKELIAFYDQAEKIGGAKAKMRLAMLTMIPSVIAGSTPDSEENLKIFRAAMQEIEKEIKTGGAHGN